MRSVEERIVPTHIEAESLAPSSVRRATGMAAIREVGDTNNRHGEWGG
jgi:hypothetical protein